jgi:organic radical activating enzyme
MGLAVQNDGDFCACNISTWSYTNRQQEVLFAHKNTLTEAWTSPVRKMLAAGLDYGKSVKGCDHCRDLEFSGAGSARQKYNNLFDHLEPLPNQPRVLIMKPGNVCNMACRMCNPATSTLWYQDAYKLAIAHDGFVGTQKEYTQRFETIRSAFNQENSLWDTTEQWLPNLELFVIYGGEPFLMQELFKTLKTVADAGKSSTVSLQLHTNATLWNPEYLDTLTKYKHVSIGLSIDSDVAEHLEYIRYPVKATEVFQNLKRYKNWADQHMNIDLFIPVTITPLNIFYFDSIKENLSESGLSVRDNFVFSPIEYDVRHIPLPVRKIIAKKLEKYPTIVNFLMQTIPGCDVAWPKFWKITKELDRIRSQSFESTFPEFYELINPYV